MNTTFWKNKRVLITGHTGFKGSWLCLLLYKMGAEVTGYSTAPPTYPSLFELSSIHKLINSIQGDVRDLQKLTNTIKHYQPEIIIHMAAQSLVRKSYKTPVETYEVNVMGTVNLFESIRNNTGVKAVVNVTSDKCYENKEWLWSYREYEPMGGYDPYSNSKGCSELITASYRNSFFNPSDYKNHGVALASARAGNVIGGGDWADDRLIPDLMRSIVESKKIKIRNPNAIRPWQHVLEPLTGYLMLAEKLYTKGPIYAEGWNFGPFENDVRTVEWIINSLCTKWGEGAAYEIDENPQLHEANYLKLDCSKARALLDWHPRWNLERTLDSIIEWYKVFMHGGNMESLCYKQISDYLTNKYLDEN